MNEEIVKRLLDVAQRRAGINNYRFDFQVKIDLENFVQSGINRLSESQLKSEAVIQEAQKNILELVDLMTQNARSRNLTESLDRNSLNFSIRGFCPRFPFC